MNKLLDWLASWIVGDLNFYLSLQCEDLDHEWGTVRYFNCAVGEQRCLHCGIRRVTRTRYGAFDRA